MPFFRYRPLSRTPTSSCPVFFFFNDTATTEIYTLSLHDALPISLRARQISGRRQRDRRCFRRRHAGRDSLRSEEHTSELQSQSNLVCRLLLEKKQYAPPSYSPRSSSRIIRRPQTRHSLYARSRT